jgi:hypothetical protein
MRSTSKYRVAVCRSVSSGAPVCFGPSSRAASRVSLAGVLTLDARGADAGVEARIRAAAYQQALQQVRESKADAAEDSLAAAVARGDSPLAIERLKALSILASLDAKQGAYLLATSTAHPSGASGAC